MNSEGGSAAHSWHSWWKEEKGYMSRLRLAEKTTVRDKHKTLLFFSAHIFSLCFLSSFPFYIFKFIYLHFLSCVFQVLWRAAIYIVLSVGISGFRDLNAEKMTKFLHMVLISGGSFVGLLYVDWLGACGQSRCTPRPTALTRFLKIPLVLILISSFVVFISRDSFLLHVSEKKIHLYSHKHHVFFVIILNPSSICFISILRCVVVYITYVQPSIQWE